mgnify:CR=1 FL=1
MEDEQDYNDNEEALIQTVSTISSELLLSDCILHIAANEIVRIDSEIEICGIDMKSSSTLIIEESGILKIKNGNDITFDNSEKAQISKTKLTRFKSAFLAHIKCHNFS